MLMCRVLFSLEDFLVSLQKDCTLVVLIESVVVHSVALIIQKAPVPKYMGHEVVYRNQLCLRRTSGVHTLTQ